MNASFRFIDFLKLGRKVGLIDAAVFYGRYVAGLTPSYGGISLRHGTSDLEVFKQIFVWEEYAYPIRGDVRTIIDAGANVGCSSVWFARRFPQATIYALEPEPGNFRALQGNTRAYPNIICIPCGLWNKSCNLKVEASAVAAWAFRMVETFDGDPDGVASMSVDDIMEDYGISRVDILKVDIETSEKRLFDQTSSHWIPKMRYIFIETHDFMEKGCAKAVTSAVFDFDFDMYTLGENLVFVNNSL